MATLKALIRKSKVNNDGIAVVQIALCHHQQTAYIPTDIKVTAENFVGGMVIKGGGKASLNARIAEQLNKYNERLAHIEMIDAKDIHQLKLALCQERMEGYHKISKCFDAFEERKPKGSRSAYDTAYKVFKVFCQDNDVNLESIDCAYIQRYDEWLHEYTPFRTQQGRNKKHSWTKIEEYRQEHPQPRHYSEASISTYLAKLKAVINWCIKEGWVSYKVHPFAKTVIKTPKRRENILSAFDLQKIKNYSTANPRYQRARDMFMLSFYLGGANLADMVRFNYLGEEITFERQKITSRLNGRATVTVPLLEEAREIAKKYICDDGYFHFNQSVTNLTSDFDYCIKQIADELGIKSYITFTSARKALAQIGTNLGISDNYLNYLLGHSMSKARGMMNPYSAMEKKLAGEVLKIIVTMSDHPDKIEEVFQDNLKNILKNITKQ